jgi:biopolymer transport protein ExbD
VVIAARGDARYREVIKVLDRLQTSGVHKVGLLAQPASGN